ALNGATSANTANALMRRDAQGGVAAGAITLDGNVAFSGENSTATAGMITKNSLTFLHNPGSNTYLGLRAGQSNSGGVGGNTAVGADALRAQTSGYRNTAVGERAGMSITTGLDNTLIGSMAGSDITTGFDN